MATVSVSIGSLTNFHQYDDGDVDKAFETTAPIAIGAPVDDGDAARKEDVDGVPDGDVYGPASSTDNTIARVDGTDNKTIQGSLVTIDDDGSINIPSGQGLEVNSVKVVGAQGSAITSASAVSAITLGSGADSVDRTAFNTSLSTLVSEINALNDALNTVLGRLRDHGLIASS